MNQVANPENLSSLDGIPTTLEECRKQAESLVRGGMPLAAYDLARRGLDKWQGDSRLRQVLAIALLNTKANDRALAILQELRQEGATDEETLGLIARAKKDQALNEPDPARRHAAWQEALAAYQEAYQTTGGYWTGINVACLALVAGNGKLAASIADEVLAQCQEELHAGPSHRQDLYWLKATIAEAALVQGRVKEAAHWYAEGVSAAPGNLRDLASTRANARLIMDALGLSAEQHAIIEECLPVGSVVVFTGHMLDRSNRPQPRFPASLERDVGLEIHARLKALDASVGFASAACGADILFLEAMAELGGQINIVLPYNQEDFVQHSVAFAGPAWVERMERVLSLATEVITTSDEPLMGGGVSFDYANRILLGLAFKKAEQLDAPISGLAVWDGQPGDGPGGTADNVDRWRRAGLDLFLINPTAPDVSATNQTPPKMKPASPTTDTTMTGEVLAKAMVFADAKGFSRLNERQIQVFVERYLAMVAGLLAKPEYQALGRETWGDGLYVVFETAQQAGLFALELAGLVSGNDWESLGVPKDISLRVALHAGPVYAYQNPVTQQMGFTGSHVNRTARIEPITPPGMVYASQAFAAIAAADQAQGFTCEYVGRMPLAKGYGELPVFLVRRDQPQPNPV